MKLTYSEIQKNIAEIANKASYNSDLIFELLAAYGRSASTITQLKQGTLNKSDDENVVLQKEVVYLYHLWGRFYRKDMPGILCILSVR